MSSLDEFDIKASMTMNQMVTEVREALAGLDGKKIPDATIRQQYKRFVLPEMQEIFSDKVVEQYHIDSCCVIYTAEKSFKSWLAKQQMMFGDLQVSINVPVFTENLESRRKSAFRAAGVRMSTERESVEFSERTDGMLR